MDLTKIKLFDLMQSNLNYLSSRQTVLAQNIGNANTPGYEAKDVKKPDFAKLLSGTHSSGLATTNPAHISGTGFAGGKKVIDSKSFEVSPTGNKVVLEDETMKMSQTGMEYQETTNLYRKMMEMLKTAIGNV